MRLRTLGLSILFICGLQLAAPPARADRAAAREAYKQATRLFEVGDYKAALDAFKQAYLNHEDPAFLFNMAQCQRLLGAKQEAIRTYRLYLRKMPDSPNHAEVERIVTSLEEAVAKEKVATELPPQGVDNMTPREHTAAQRPETTAPPSSPSAAPAQAVLVAQPAGPKTPVYKKWWLWTVVGGVAVVGVAVGLGVGLGTRADFKPTFPEVGPGSALSVKP
jgi:tetratricopeptide (TPR) repeat protein